MPHPDPALPSETLLERVRAEIGPISRVEKLGESTAYTALLSTSKGSRLVLKFHEGLDPQSFVMEADALQSLARLSPVPVVRVIAAGPGFLLLEEAKPTPSISDESAWRTFGEQIAALHAISYETFGWHTDVYWGPFRWANPPTPDGAAFHLCSRLLPLIHHPNATRHFSAAELSRFETFAHRLTQLIPPQGPALLHGDLWVGNVLANAAGACLLIDPSPHYGWPDWDLAMSTMWSAGFPSAFWNAYRHDRPLPPDHRQHLEILTFIPELATVLMWPSPAAIQRCHELCRLYG